MTCRPSIKWFFAGTCVTALIAALALHEQAEYYKIEAFLHGAAYYRSRGDKIEFHWGRPE